MDRYRLTNNRKRYYCLTPVSKPKKYIYKNLDHENVSDNKIFRKSIKPLISEKAPHIVKLRRPSKTLIKAKMIILQQI